jgi:hypothetical protein
MPDRFSGPLDMAKRGRLTPEESEERTTMLNAPVMAPAGHAVAGFVSKRTFEPSDLPARIKAIRWFSKCGEPLALDLTMNIESVRSWPAAMQECQSVAWENIELAAQNQGHPEDRQAGRPWHGDRPQAQAGDGGHRQSERVMSVWLDAPTRLQ